jgi:hypothetical protein
MASLHTAPLSTAFIYATIALTMSACSSTTEPVGGQTPAGQADANAAPDDGTSSTSDSPADSGPDATPPGDSATGPEDTPPGPADDIEAPPTDGAPDDSEASDVADPLDTGVDLSDAVPTDGSAEDTSAVDVIGPGDLGEGDDTGSTADGAAAPEACLFGGLPCPEGESCDTGGCGLGLEGICTAKPLECEPSADSVCACDGNSYASACFALQAGQRAIGPGPCPAVALNCDVDTTGWGFGTGCDVNEYCFGGCVGEGFCKQRPICGNEPGEVQCACNGLDYATPCTLATAGKNLDHVSWCGEPNIVELCAGPDELECIDPAAYCDLQSCEPQAIGICLSDVTSADACPPNSPPECGCDDVTYTNMCARVLAGVALKHIGTCGDGACELSEPGDCGSSMFCAGLIGECIGPGLCEPAPFNCDLLPGDNAPVCGCNGASFESMCQAQKADVPVAYFGECDG